MRQPSLRAQRSNPWLSKPRYGLLRGGCHRARIRATRWLAMTKWRQSVGWAKAQLRRAHHLSPITHPNGGHASLCPPYRTKPICPTGDLLRAQAQLHATARDKLARRANHQKTCPAPFAKIFCFRSHPNQSDNFAVSLQMRGARERHERAVRCGGRGRRARRTRRMRTVKSCGSGAAVLASSCADSICAATEAKEPFSGKSTK
jgi:hypothetical protein